MNDLKLKPEQKTMKFSKQAQGAVMMALQKCIAEQSDIMEIFDAFLLADSDDGLVVLNPPMVRVTPEFDA